MAGGGALQLVEQLLMAVGTGSGSVARMGAIAAAVEACSPGLGLQELAAMQGHHAERALHRWAQRQHWRSMLPQLYQFNMVKLGRGTQSTVPAPRPHWALLPHELFASLYGAAPDLFRSLFYGDEANLVRWWAAEAALGQPWHSSHPVVAQTPANLRAPYGIRGDDAGMHGGEAVLVLTWGPTAVGTATLDTRLVFGVLRLSEAAKPASVDTLLRVLTWSLQALSTGRHPHADEEGRPFGPDHHPSRAAVAGTLLAGGFCGPWAEMRGDWKFLQEALNLQRYWARRQVCHLCLAERRGPLVFTDFRRHSPLRETLVADDEWLQEAQAGARVSPLVAIPGFAIWRVFFDIMHCLDLGVLQVAIPSALAELVRPEANVWPGRRVEERLAAATAAYRAWCIRHRVGAVAKRFTRQWVAGPFPQLTQAHAKASALRSMQYWLQEVTAAHAADLRGQLRASLFAALVRADVVCRRASRHMLEGEREELAAACEEALLAYNALAAAAVEAGVPLWKVLPKHHALSHIAYDNGGVNPRWVSCYPDEDMVGRVKRIYQRCHGQTAPERCLQRYLILLGLRWQTQALALRGMSPPATAGSAQPALPAAAG